MAKGFFSGIGDFFSNLFSRKPVKAVETVAEAVVETAGEIVQDIGEGIGSVVDAVLIEPLKIFAPDKEARRAKQKKLASRRKQKQYRAKREEIQGERAAKLPTIHEVAAHIIRVHQITNPSQKMRVLARVRTMTEQERRVAIMMNEHQLVQMARDQNPEHEDGKGNPVNPFWYH